MVMRNIPHNDNRELLEDKGIVYELKWEGK